MSAAPASTDVPAAPAPVETPAPREIVVTDEAHQGWEFPSTPAVTPSAPKVEPTPEVVPPAPTPEAKTEPEDIDDETFERIKNSPRVKNLIDGSAGQKVQAERAKIEAATAQRTRAEVLAAEGQWNKSLADYNKLQESDEFYQEQVTKLGKAKVTRFMADVEALQEARSKQPVEPVFDEAAYHAGFNTAAMSEFQSIVKAAMPSYAELPEATLAAIDGLKYDPDGSIYGKDSNWLHHAMVQLGKGYEAHIAKLERTRATDLASATEAGKNDALAEREAGAPVVVRSESNDMANLSWEEVNNLYADGSLPGGNKTYREYKRKFGIDY